MSEVRRGLPAQLEFWDDERDIGNGVIVTLTRGWSFYHFEHLGVMGFDTVSAAREAIKKKKIYPCTCDFCLGKTNAA